ILYDTDGMSLAEFFKQHLSKVNFSNSIKDNLVERLKPLEKISKEEIDKIKSETPYENKTDEFNLTLAQFQHLGINDNKTLINKGTCSAADILQFCLQNKLALLPHDKDMVVMLHEIIYKINDTTYEIKSELIVKGEDNLHTAMAKTVGLPLGIAAKLILDNSITLKGLHIPIIKEIYVPVLQELKKYGIVFN